MKLEKAEILKTVRGFLENRQEVMFGYIFGSLAQRIGSGMLTWQFISPIPAFSLIYGGFSALSFSEEEWLTLISCENISLQLLPA